MKTRNIPGKERYYKPFSCPRVRTLGKFPTREEILTDCGHTEFLYEIVVNEDNCNISIPIVLLLYRVRVTKKTNVISAYRAEIFVQHCS